MSGVTLVLFFIGACYCQVEFNDRPRNFSIELLYYTQAETQGHVVLSPFGIWTLMVGLSFGATGESYKQISRAFILPKKQSELTKGYKELSSAVLQMNNGVSLTSMNFVFLDNDFSIYPAFRGTIQNDFGASLKVLDFDDPNSARIANTYIEKSGGRVKNVLRSDDFRESRMILTNVISFKGLWKSPFNKTDTMVEPFYDENKNVIGEVNMMFQQGPFPFAALLQLKAFVVELPYGTDGKYSMIIILPYPNTKIADVYKKFAKVSLKDVIKKLDNDVSAYGMDDVDIKLPRFHISTNVVMNKPLNDMGVYDIFQPDLARFQRVTNDNIFVSAIVHTADIEVTESGTVASAATTASFSDRMSAPAFHANRPFVYFIIERSTVTVIFSGIYSKPSVF